MGDECGLTSNEMSAIVFQMVASTSLACCALAYLSFGFLCFDRFTSKAFLKENPKPKSKPKERSKPPFFLPPKLPETASFQPKPKCEPKVFETDAERIFSTSKMKLICIGKNAYLPILKEK